jgi:MtrB/PioB family decaheme-associated outer membrane protein
MKRTTISVLIVGLFASAAVLADDVPWITEGAITAGGMFNSNSGRDFSKLEEYRDLNSGVLSNIFLRGRDDKNWIDFYGENFGRDDMYIALRGGQYDAFKYRVYTNWLPHNFAFQALTPLQGQGTTLQTANFPQPNPATWNSFNLGYQRKDTGGYFEWQATAPWYFRVEGNQVTFDGSKVGSGALGTSPGNGFMDLAIPVSYTTTNVSAEGGYSTSRMHFAVSYLYSKFDNGNQSIQWTNPFFGNNLDQTYLPLDNSYQRIGVNGMIKDLPLGSTFSARYTYAKTTSDSPVALMALTAGSTSGTGVYVPTMPNQTQFNGDFVNQTLALSLTSAPVKDLSTKVYYNFNKLDNDSTQLSFTPGPLGDCDGGPCSNALYRYTKNNVGIEGTWRINRANRLAGGWDYLDVDQNRVDYDHVRFNKLWAEWKNTSLENLDFRIKYQYIQRRSDFLLGNSGVDANDPNFLARSIARFDNSDSNQNYLKGVLNWSPMPMLDTSLEATYKNNDYPGTVLGRTKDHREYIFGTVSYGDPQKMRITLMGDYEWVKYDSFHRVVGSSTCDPTSPNCFDPNTAPTSFAYNYSANNKDDNWLIGVGLDWQATERFLVKASVMYFQSDGSSDVISQNNFGNPLPINTYDNWKQTALNLKGIYTFNKSWSFTAGYAYQRTRYGDIAYDGYQYTIPFPGVTTNTGQSYLNGYRAFTNGDANTVYLLATFRFP